MINKNIREKLQKGDRQAFNLLFRTYYRALTSYAFSFLNDWEEAEEIVQNVFFKLWKKRELLGIHTSLKSYLYTSVHNECLNLIKHMQVKAKYMDYVVKTQPSLNESDYLLEKELQAQIEQAISELPTERRRIFEMSRFEGLKYQEIADKLNISVKTVESQMSKALRFLRNNLKEYIPMLFYFFF